jgi:hypothetical protein
LPGNFNRFQVRSEASGGLAATDGDRAFVEWWATFDGDAPVAKNWPGPFGLVRQNGANRSAVSRAAGLPGSRNAATGEAGDRSQPVSG